MHFAFVNQHYRQLGLSTKPAPKRLLSTLAIQEVKVPSDEGMTAYWQHMQRLFLLPFRREGFPSYYWAFKNCLHRARMHNCCPPTSPNLQLKLTTHVPTAMHGMERTTFMEAC